MLFLFSVDDVPLPGDTSMGIQALPSITGNGAIVQSWQYFLELVCSSTDCKWTGMEKKLSTPVSYAVMMYLPKDYHC